MEIQLKQIWEKEHGKQEWQIQLINKTRDGVEVCLIPYDPASGPLTVATEEELQQSYRLVRTADGKIVDEDQPYLPEFRRLKIICDHESIFLFAEDHFMKTLSDWSSRKNFVGFEYEHGRICAEPILYSYNGGSLENYICPAGLDGLEIARPKWVLVKE